MSDNSINKEIDVKVVLLGESGVGKSCIILRYTNDQYSDNNLSTILCSTESKLVSLNNNNDLVKFNIWDTAGQEKFRAISRINYRDADVIILVFDITSPESFQCLKEYWYPQVKENAPKCALLALVAAKCDLKNDLKIDLTAAKTYAEEIKAMFKETSSLSNSGINELFQEIAEKILTSDNFKDNNKKKRNNIPEMTNDDEGSDNSDKTGTTHLKNFKTNKEKSRCC